MRILGLSLTRSLFIGLITFATIAVNASIPEIKPGTPFTPLEPTREESITTQQVMSNLLRGHYERKRLNDDLSSQVLDTLLDDIDSTHSYLLQSDVKDFEQFRKTLDEALSRGNMKPAFYIYNRFQQRVNERLSFLLSELKENAGKYTFDSDETLNLDREEQPWATSPRELNDLWRKRLKNSILNLRLAGKEDDAIIELLTKRYQNQLNRVHQSKPVDAYQTFMNAVTRSFDPHTQYFSPRNSENFNINMSLKLQGIGAVLQTEDEHTKVVRLVPGGPAAKADNLEPEDKIVGVGQDKDGEIIDVVGWRLDEVVDLIRGPKNSTVRLEIIQGNDSTSGDSKIIAITRDEVKLEEQSAQKEVIEVIDNGETRRIGVIDIPTFYIDFQGRMENRPDYRSTTRDVRRLITELQEENIDGLMIDLRSNGGGSLEEAINLTGLFIPTGPVVQVRGARGNVEVLQDLDPEVLYSGPMTVVVNRLSASASEIFAGAIQDYGRGLVIGGQTFGKGTVQSLRPLTEGQLKITQAKFYRVSGESTQHQGVIPDIMFPSLFDKEKIGESALTLALPWDTIKPARDMKNNPITSKIPQLRDLHNVRIEDNPDFIFMREQKDLVTEMRGKTEVSLNEKVRRSEREVNDERRLALENKRRLAKGMPVLDSIDDDTDKTEDKQNSSKKSESSDDEIEGVADADTKNADDEKEPDAMLQEAGHILLDYMKLSSPAPGMTALR
ncbi:MAG: carboxy terminal-processing peptidase [Alcanivorax sp.]|jgi:carboxyl-terminal processing protease|nr:MAG: tail-specific protease [Oceanobacter sp.]